MKNRSKGFTLAELLIVVAIIGVLVAISIPIFSSQLSKARLAADQANVRSAKAAAAAEYMSNGESGSVSYLYDGSQVIPVNSSTVSRVSSITASEGYGKSRAADNSRSQTGASGTPEKGFVEVTVDDSAPEQISARWVTGTAVFNSQSGDLILTGNVINNRSIKDQVSSLKVDADSITTVIAADGSRIDDDTAAAFAGLNNLRKIDLSKAKLYHSSYELLDDLPDSVQEIVLPDSTSSYNIKGTWYDSSGNKLPIGNWAPKGESKEQYSRIDTAKLHTGDHIYRSSEAARQN